MKPPVVVAVPRATDARMQSARTLFMLMLASLCAVVASTAIYAAARAQSEPAAPADATLTVAHFAPFSGDVAATSVSVQVNSSDVITEFVFGEREKSIPLPAGTYTISIVPTGVVTPALVTTATVTTGVDYTLAAIGGANGWPLELYALVNDSTPLTSTGKVRITHLAPFAPTSDGTKVDICTQAGDPVPGLTGIPYKASTGYLPLPAGLYDLAIAAAGTDCATVALDLPPFAVRAGQVVDIFAVGSLLNLAPQTAGAAGGIPVQVVVDGLTARIAVGHFAPFANTAVGTSVSVALSGTTVLTDFVFGTLTPYIEVQPAAYPVAITPTGSATPAITGTANITGFVDFTLAAIGNGSAQPLALARLVDDNLTPPPSGQARLRLTHFAPIAATIPGTAVDVCATGSNTPVAAGFLYKASAFLNLPAGSYDTFVAAPGTACATILFDIPPFKLTAGQIAYLYAVGDITNQPAGAVVNGMTLGAVVRLPLVSKQIGLDIVETAVGAGQFNTLAAALTAADLVNALKGPGPFTVFAPTDAAFAKLPQVTLDALLADPSDALTDILKYHVLPGRIVSAQLTPGLKATTLQGAQLTFAQDAQGRWLVNGELIAQADVLATNGVIHVIGDVLLPPAQ